MTDRTPSQTIGPFFHEALRWKDGVAISAPGPRVALIGRMFDGAGEPVGDAMVESWPQSPAGFTRVETRKDGTFRIDTAMPAGKVPCLDVAIFARGLLKPLRTRVYLAPEGEVRAEPFLKSIATSPRLATLVARPSGEGEYRWDVRLQGEGETVFFAV